MGEGMDLKKIPGILSDLKRNSRYYCKLYKTPLKEKHILIESKNGGDLAGNMFAILRELAKPEYDEYVVYLSYTKKKKQMISDMLERYGITKAVLLLVKSKKYYTVLATAKYLFTDTSFMRSFVKREGQIITNTWHGTPLKYMGTDVKNRIYAMGNVQRNLLFSDYLVYPNEYMKEKMTESYLLTNLYQGTILNEGYPRNSCFFDPEYGKQIRDELGLQGKKVALYMPTWRGTLTKKASDQLILMMEYYLRPLDCMMSEEQVLYVKLHPFVHKEMKFDRYKHIKPYPEQYDTYEFLNMSDVLVTDYSSVFYDFANSGKKIVLFPYDEGQYIRERGVYTRPEEMCFPVVRTAEELYHEMITPKNYDDTEFRKYCCTFDAPGAAERICRHVIKGEKCCKEEKIKSNGKKNVLVYSGGLFKNGITTAMRNLFDCMDREKYNYYFSFLETSLKAHPMSLSVIPEEIGFIPVSSDVAPTFSEMIACFFYYRSKMFGGRFEKILKNRITTKYRNRMYEREFQKHFGSAKLDCVVQYVGYGIKTIALLEMFKGKKVIFVHNNMIEELRSKNNQNPVSLEDAYRNYDKVAVVTKDIIPPTVEISGCTDNIVQISNCHNYKDILRRADEPIVLDKNTKLNRKREEFLEKIEDDAIKIITIGRFSAEKGHQMLIEAYRRLRKEFKGKKLQLIIIGGYGPLFQHTTELANQADADITVIRSMSNPMPVLKRCDYFVLSSTYEGLGLTLLEAVTLGLPVISTDIPGPKGFMERYGGKLVEPNVEGIYEGMKACLEGKVQKLQVDFEEYNREAAAQFERMMEELL